MILSANDKEEEKMVENPKTKILVDDNILHQIQKMFTFLELSERRHYDGIGFCHSFKDVDGNPVNTIE